MVIPHKLIEKCIGTNTVLLVAQPEICQGEGVGVHTLSIDSSTEEKNLVNTY